MQDTLLEIVYVAMRITTVIVVAGVSVAIAIGIVGCLADAYTEQNDLEVLNRGPQDDDES